MKFVKVENIIEHLELEVINKSSDMDELIIESSEIIRPGLQISGYFEKFVPERIQILGSAEWHYLRDLGEELRRNRLEAYFSKKLKLIIVSRGLSIFPEMIEMAKKYDTTILQSKELTSKVVNRIVAYIDLELAEETRMHGVLVEVYGIGVLITGKSGVGKSETALDLVIRGHRLISDDTVIVKRVEDGLVGKSPDITRHFMEIRGLGILDIERLYGVASVRNQEYINMVIELETWDKDKEYDRIGLEENYTNILDHKVPINIIPVRPGRNVAMIIEVAARNHRQRRLGYNAAYELNERIKKQIESRKREVEESLQGPAGK